MHDLTFQVRLESLNYTFLHALSFFSMLLSRESLSCNQPRRSRNVYSKPWSPRSSLELSKRYHYKVRSPPDLCRKVAAESTSSLSLSLSVSNPKHTCDYEPGLDLVHSLKLKDRATIHPSLHNNNNTLECPMSKAQNEIQLSIVSSNTPNLCTVTEQDSR